jgi:two-component SAPR family response regulator/LysM repeat protein
MARFLEGHAGVNRSAPPPALRRADASPLAWLITSLAAAGTVLYVTAGPPRLPSQASNPDLLLGSLRSSSLPLDAVGYVITTVAWLIWAWLLLSLVLRIVVAAADMATHGADWVRSLRGLSDWVTIPVVRRAVDTALATAMVVQVVAHAAPASAAPLSDQPASVAYVDASAPLANAASPVGRNFEEYTVQPGDTLFSIAERFYGTGDEFPRLVEANLDRPMRDGAAFSAEGVIQTGWVLRVPLANTKLNVDDNGQAWYTVERGDTLWGLSARFLGDPTRWPELFQSNQGASLDHARTLTNPNLIWPGLRLTMPVTVEQDTATLPPPPAVAPPPLPPADDGSTLQAPSAPSGAQTVGVQNGVATQAAPATAAASAVAAAALLALRRRGRRGLAEPPLAEEPESDVVVRAGFAELRDLSRSLATPVEAAATEVLRLLDANELGGRVGLVSARHGRSSTTLALVSQRMADRPRLLQLGPLLQKHLGVSAQAQLSRDHDTLLRLGGLRRARFADSPRGASKTPCVLLPTGVLPDRRVLYINWPSLGHTLIAGRATLAVNSVLSTLLASIAARFDAAELQVLTIGRPASVSEPLTRLPHQVGQVIDPDDHVRTSAALHDARAELLQRMERVERGGNVNALSELLLVIPDVEALAEHASTLDMLGVYGPAHRVRLLVASSHPELLSDTLLAHFTTRAVLRLADDMQGARLLGQPGAADLLGGGQLLLRLDAREPLELYAFRASDAELDRFVRTMRGEPMPVHTDTRWAAVPDDDDDDPDPTPPFGPAPRQVQHVVDFSQRATAPAITLRCFGGFDVLAGERDVTSASSPAEAAQRASAWEVLAYLGSYPEGVAGRDDLLAAVWANAEPRIATANLTTVVEQLNVLLRHSFNEQLACVEVDERNAVVRLDPERVDSDVHRFVRLCQAAPMMPFEGARAALTRARELYRGDLLDGPGARSYSWAVDPPEDGELSLRDGYHEQYLRATLRLGRLLLRAGEHQAAIPLFHSLLEVEPLLEDVVRDLCRCYAALGDGEAVVAEEHRLRAALRQACATYSGPNDDGPDPEPATTALAAELLQELELGGTVRA